MTKGKLLLIILVLSIVGVLLYTLTIDSPPKIKNYSLDVEAKSFSINAVDDKGIVNIYGYMIRPDNIKISLTFTQVNSTLYKAQVPFDDKLEGLYKLYVNVSDGSHVVPLSLNVTFAVPPEIVYKNFYPHNYKLYIDLGVKEFSGLAKRVLVLNNRTYSLNVTGINDGTYSLNGIVPIDEGENSFKIILVDKFNKTTEIQKIKINYRPAVTEKIAHTTGFPLSVVERIYYSAPRLVEKLFKDDQKTLIALLRKAETYQGTEKLLDQIYRDRGLRKRIDAVRKIIPYINTDISYWTAKLLGNYSKGLTKMFPSHDSELLKGIVDAANKHRELVDLEPRMIVDYYGNKIVIVSCNVTRDFWMLVEHIARCIKDGYNVLSFPEIFEGLKWKVLQNAWDLLDDPYGPGFYDGVNYTFTDNNIWEAIMMQWKYYADSYPQFGNRSGRYIYFPIYDSTKLKDEWIRDDVNRTIAELLFWNLQPRAIDMETGKKVFGINGTKLFIKQLPKEYQKIMSIYPNGKVRCGKYPPYYWADPRMFYYLWIGDRGQFLPTVFKQFLGVEFNRVKNMRVVDFMKIVNRYNGIHQYLNKIFPEWDLIVFAYGVNRWDPVWPGEAGQYTFGIPQTFAALGIPFTWIDIYPHIGGASPYEWGVVLPDPVIYALVSKCKNSIVIGLGNTFGLHNCRDELFKDGVKEIVEWIPPREKSFYLTAKKD